MCCWNHVGLYNPQRLRRADRPQRNHDRWLSLRLAQYVREEFSRRAYAAGTQSYDDLLYHMAKLEGGNGCKQRSQNAIRPH